MNSHQNTNVVWTIVTKSGETHVMKCRNTTVSWARGVERLGVETHDIDYDRCHVGLPESDRV